MSGGKEKPCLPYGWEVHQSTTYPERVYYYNNITHLSSWKCPQLISPADSSQSASQTSLPPLLADRSIVFPEEKKHVSTDQPAKTVTSPKTLPVLSPAYAKATSPQCVSSSSEVKVQCLSSDASNLKSQSSKSLRQPPSKCMPIPSKSIAQTSASIAGQRKLVRTNTCINRTNYVSERNNNIRYNPYNAERKDAKSNNFSNTPKTTHPQPNNVSERNNNIRQNPYKAERKDAKSNSFSNNVKTTHPQPSKETERSRINLRCSRYSAENGDSILNTSLKTIVKNNQKKKKKKKNRANQLSSTVPPVSGPAGQPTRPQLRTTLQYITNRRKAQSASSVGSQVTPVTYDNSNQKSSISPLLFKKNIEVQKSPEKGLSTSWTHSEVVVPDYTSDVEMVDVSHDSIDSGSSKGYFIVVDTNVLISNLKLVDELKDSPLQGCGPPTVIIPWIVLQELDHIKNGKYKEDKVQKASEAVRYIYEMFSAKHPRICGQSSLENLSKLEGSLEPSCNDDMILHCCLQMCKKVPSEKVILLTNDKNLCNKATVHQLQAYTADTLFQNLKVDFTDATSIPSYAISCNISLPNELSNSEGNLRLEVDRVMIQAKSALKNCLAEFLKNEMYSAYEGDMWLKVVHLKPPWSLLDILECLSKHWIAVFNFVLGRQMKNHIDKMHSALKTTKGYIFDEGQALGLVSSGISLCTNIASKGSTTANETLDKLILLQKQLLCLGKNNTHVNSDSINSNDTQISGPSIVPPTVNQRRNSESLVVEQDPSLEVNTRVKMVFQHVWFFLNHLCGTVLDSLGWPHKLEYNRPPALPSKDETDKFIPVLYPELQKLRKYMMSVVPAKDICDEKFNSNISGFYKQVLGIMPSLNANKLPVSITEEEFKQFCTNADNTEILQGGLKQLLQFFALIHKSIVGTAGQK